MLFTMEMSVPMRGCSVQRVALPIMAARSGTFDNIIRDIFNGLCSAPSLQILAYRHPLRVMPFRPL